MINYFDLGLLHGDEIQMFIDSVGDREYKVYGFEANPFYYEKCKERFKDNPNVTIYNYAITDSNKMVKLYLEPTGEGSSIFLDKNNVTKEFVEVQGINFIKWVIDYPCKLAMIDILRFNIEGAELQLIESIINAEHIWAFDLYLGSMESDLLKVESLKDKNDYYQHLLKEHNIDIKPFCSVYNRKDIPINNFDLKEWINKLKNV